MDIATDSVVVRRERKTAVLTVDMLRALALTAVKNAIDPEGQMEFGGQDAMVNPDGSITVSVLTETEVQPTPAPAPAAPVAPVTPSIPMTIVGPATA